MGQIAHDFSNSKPQLLDSAQECFKAALSCLPVPYASAEGGSYDQLEITPSVVSDSPTSSKLRSPYVSPSPSVVESLSAQSELINGLSYRIPSALACESARSLSISLQTTPTFQREDEKEKEKESGHGDFAAPKTPIGHKHRLCQSLSFTHSLQDDLVPSPLFNRNQKRAQIYSSRPELSRRPLPPLPFGHSTTFAVEGSRVVQVPQWGMRKSAVQTLIAKYEDTTPLTQTPSPRRITQNNTSVCSPVTPRFRRIRDAFSPDPRNDSLEAYLSSADLTRYNLGISDFRTQLRKHISSLEVEVRRVRDLQAQRMARKAQRKHRRTSFWTFQPANQLAPTLMPSDTEKKGGLNDPVTAARKERIERLRREGWNVRKEKYGFKGVEWYEAFRCRVEKEIAEYERAQC